MASDSPEARDSHITTDPDQIESWARETNTVPVRIGENLRLIKEGSYDDDRMERLDWDDFEAAIQDSDRVVVYREEDERDPLQVRHRADAMTHLESEDVEERLLEGEVVTGTVTETATIERTLVEAAEIESEIVDREITNRRVVDVALISRECNACDLEEGSAGAYLDTYDADYFRGESGDQLADREDLRFELDVDEAWAVTFEEREEYTVESRVVDVTGSETDEVEAVGLHSDIDESAINRHLVGSNLFDVDFRNQDDVDAAVHEIDTEVGEDDTIHTTLTQHRTVEREVAMSHDVMADATGSERNNVQTAHEEVIESGLAEREGETATGESTTGTVAAGSETTSEADTATEAGETAGRTTPSEGDEGKTVVDQSGDKIGVVTEVDAETAYVDPDPSITERLMARLGWADADEGNYAVGPQEIARITDDQVELIAAE